MNSPIAYLNGRWHPYAEAALPWHDAGFVMGATVTDLVRTFGGRLFRLDEHIERFRRSCEYCAVPAPEVDIAEIARELVLRNYTGQELGLVMFATPGHVGFYGGLPGGAGDGPPTFGMHTFPLPLERYRRLFTEGARLIVPPMPANRGVDPRAKQRSRMHWWLASRQARAIDPLAEAVLVDDRGHLTETASANLIVVKDRELLVLPADTVLGGISLAVTLDLANGLGLTVRETPITVADAGAADEILLTCTTWCLAGVSRFEGQAMRWPGPVYKELNAEWASLVPGHA